MSDIRFALCHSIRTGGLKVAAAAREFGVNRKTAHKWLAVFDAAATGGEAAVSPRLADRSRRPKASPGKTCDRVETAALALRDRHNWGPRKIRAVLAADPGHVDLPSIRTISTVLRRHGRIKPPAATKPELTRFERSKPNELWQLDFKGPVEVGHRRKVMPMAILDDHSRYLLSFRPCKNVQMTTAFSVLWEVLGEVGMPEQILCDNAFATMGTANPAGISWFESRLFRLGIDCSHGRPYHPQTQGKVERLNGTADRELIGFNARRDTPENFAADAEAWRNIYNTVRPHESLGDLPPATRYRPSATPRPATLPEPDYPPGSVLRVVSDSGQITVRSLRILCGRGIAGDSVRIEDRGNELAVFYCRKQIRLLSREQLVRGIVL